MLMYYTFAHMHKTLFSLFYEGWESPKKMSGRDAFFFFFFWGGGWFYRSSSALTLLVFHSDPVPPCVCVGGGGRVSHCPFFSFLVAAGFQPMSLTLQCGHVTAILL